MLLVVASVLDRRDLALLGGRLGDVGLRVRGRLLGRDLLASSAALLGGRRAGSRGGGDVPTLLDNIAPDFLVEVLTSL